MDETRDWNLEKQCKWVRRERGKKNKAPAIARKPSNKPKGTERSSRILKPAGEPKTGHVEKRMMWGLMHRADSRNDEDLRVNETRQSEPNEHSDNSTEIQLKGLSSPAPSSHGLAGLNPSTALVVHLARSYCGVNLPFGNLAGIVAGILGCVNVNMDDRQDLYSLTRARTADSECDWSSRCDVTPAEKPNAVWKIEKEPQGGGIQRDEFEEEDSLEGREGGIERVQFQKNS
ncbi:hypothetical protein K438DRAFT_1779315 [Mycena galopus ATCC 62051]|nr:hypothetical protein K438DRAFT_1779315 [Mycena galopus ATCC 62051]